MPGLFFGPDFDPEEVRREFDAIEAAEADFHATEQSDADRIELLYAFFQHSKAHVDSYVGERRRAAMRSTLEEIWCLPTAYHCPEAEWVVAFREDV